jgi:hypothetical protein
MEKPSPSGDLAANLQQLLLATTKTLERARAGNENADFIAACEDQVRKVEYLIDQWTRRTLR